MSKKFLKDNTGTKDGKFDFFDLNTVIKGILLAIFLKNRFMIILGFSMKFGFIKIDLGTLLLRVIHRE